MDGAKRPEHLVRIETIINEHERVVLTEAAPGAGLEAGDVGAVVHVYKDGSVFEVEVATPDYLTAAVVTIEASQVRPISSRDITHTRERPAA